MNTTDLIEVKFPARAEYVSVIRLMVSGIAHRMGFDYDAIEDIKIAVAEACTNAVNHAYEHDKGEVKIRCEVLEDRLVFSVKDDGQGFDINRVQAQVGPIEKEQRIEDLDEGGLGLFLMKSLMDNVEIQKDNGVVVKMSKFLQRDEVETHVDQIRKKETQ